LREGEPGRVAAGATFTVLAVGRCKFGTARAI
jgi:hypothetical protein